jgi:hypothetical protein
VDYHSVNHLVPNTLFFQMRREALVLRCVRQRCCRTDLLLFLASLPTAVECNLAGLCVVVLHTCMRRPLSLTIATAARAVMFACCMYLQGCYCTPHWFVSSLRLCAALH